MRISVLILLLLGITVLALAACSSASEESGEHDTENAQSEQSGEHREGGGSGEHDEESESGEGDGEESATQYGLTDTYDVVRAGARLILSYDDSWNTFRGTVENTTDETLRRVRVEIHLSNGVELGPTTPLDLAPGQMAEITLPATKQRFETWSAHPEVGGGAEQEGAAISPEIEKAARLLLADIATADENDFTLISSESVSWSDASLGCPQEGMAYAQVITPGYKLVFTLGDTSYAVHTNADGSNLVPCNDGE